VSPRRRADRVRALLFSLAPHRVAVALATGRFRPDIYHGAGGSPLRMTTIARPARPPGWVRVAPRLTGICGSDRKYLTVTGMGMTLSALYGFPRHGTVLGHEVVGDVIEADPDAAVAVGDRVSVQPLLGCAAKSFAACPRCEFDEDHLCERFADGGTLAPGPGFGFNARYGGGWAEELVAPAGRIHRLPDALDDRGAVLVEPMAVSVHAILTDPPRPGSRVLVIGPGPIGLCMTAALRALAPDVEVTVAGLGPQTDAPALTAGAEELLHGTRRQLVEAAAAQLDSDLDGNALSGPILRRGFDVVYDCVASEQTLDDALRMTRARGSVVLVATAAKRSLDLSLVWHRELSLRGTVYYAPGDVPAGARVPAGRRHPFDVAADILVDRDLSSLVTHVFPLDEPVDALRVSAAGPAERAVKVAFAPRA
jgi:threonine dehydrogenase-like Zn-dependent dehydrogenase